ncbi:LuxR family transcriptional regulator [Blautia caecimuris]|uniref:LuxR family transcriptional regulator n=1 Tax=Blautia caecimuris TaxID=1796615 RepID=UPI003991A87D
MAAPLKYNQVYHDDWAWSLAIKGATDVEIAEAFGISVRTLNRWKKDHDSFMVALMSGKDQADAKVEKKLYERAIGYKYTEKETVMEMDSNGNRKPAKVRVVEKECPPDVLAQMYWLNNRKSAQYKRNPENFIDKSIVYEIEDMDEVEAEIYDSKD